MEPLSFIEIFTNLYKIVSSSAFFLVCLIVSLILLVFLLISIKKFNKIISKIFLLTWIICIILLIIKYYKYLLSIMDNFVENVFMSIYFPNLSIFLIVLLISNILLFTGLFKEIKPVFYKIIWLISGVLINFLFVLIIDTVVRNNIDVYTITEVYNNKELFVLLDTSMIIATSNAVLTLITLFSTKLINRRKNKEEIIENKNIETGINVSAGINENRLTDSINYNNNYNYNYTNNNANSSTNNYNSLINQNNNYPTFNSNMNNNYQMSNNTSIIDSNINYSSGQTTFTNNQNVSNSINVSNNYNPNNIPNTNSVQNSYVNNNSINNNVLPNINQNEEKIDVLDL